MDAEFSFVYDEKRVTFRSVDDRDHILNNMRRRSSFYEADVLERIRDRIHVHGSGAALDVGAFIGTHSIYFAKFCGLKPVIAFEANKNSHAILEHNVDANGCAGTIVPIQRAIGATAGEATVLVLNQDNQGSNRLSIGDDQGPDSVVVSTIDAEVRATEATLPRIALMKIDVEGAELAVLAGATETIKANRPVLCIEVHTARNLLRVMSRLRSNRYWIVDCLGYSPTYILEKTDASWLRRSIVQSLWLLRAAFLGRQSNVASRASWYLRRLAQRLSAGRWDPLTRD